MRPQQPLRQGGVAAFTLEYVASSSFRLFRSTPCETLTNVFVPSLEVLLHHGHELVGDGAIDKTVIVTES
jgi:hypothetical protein